LTDTTPKRRIATLAKLRHPTRHGSPLFQAAQTRSSAARKGSIDAVDPTRDPV
jgi:hypothetical protein